MHERICTGATQAHTEKAGCKEADSEGEVEPRHDRKGPTCRGAQIIYICVSNPSWADFHRFVKRNRAKGIALTVGLPRLR